MNLKLMIGYTVADQPDQQINFRFQLPSCKITV